MDVVVQLVATGVAITIVVVAVVVVVVGVVAEAVGNTLIAPHRTVVKVGDVKSVAIVAFLRLVAFRGR